MDNIDPIDEIAYLEMAKIAMACVPDDVMDAMDLSDDEFVRLREQLEEYMNRD